MRTSCCGPTPDPNANWLLRSNPRLSQMMLYTAKVEWRKSVRESILAQLRDGSDASVVTRPDSETRNNMNTTSWA